MLRNDLAADRARPALRRETRRSISGILAGKGGCSPIAPTGDETARS
jgi:hypothetical protein